MCGITLCLLLGVCGCNRELAEAGDMILKVERERSPLIRKGIFDLDSISVDGISFTRRQEPYQAYIDTRWMEDDGDTVEIRLEVRDIRMVDGEWVWEADWGEAFCHFLEAQINAIENER